MLDVHPAHHAATSWRDFFIHIATIVLGLLIAVGLEQTVEYFHHRHQVAETREALRIEREQNRRHFILMAWDFKRATLIMEQNLSVIHFLKLHPGTPEDKLPAKLDWSSYSTTFNDSAWKTAQQNNITALMPSDEVRAETLFYQHLYDVAEAYKERNDIDEGLYRYNDPDPSHLTPALIDQEIDAMSRLLRKQYRYGLMLRRVGNADSTFTGAPTLDYLNSVVGHIVVANKDDQRLYRAMLADIDDISKPWPYEIPKEK